MTNSPEHVAGFSRSTFFYLALTLGWSVLIGVMFRVLGISVYSLTGVLILAVLLMPSPAIATCVVHRFRWKEIADTYGLNLKRLDLLLIVRSTITFLISFGL